MTSIYKLILTEPKATLYIMYKGDNMHQLYVEVSPGHSMKCLEMLAPFTKDKLPKEAVELKPKTVQDKVVAFSMAYRAKFNVAYSASKVEKANLKNVQVNRDLLETYFTSTDYPLSVGKSMSDYTKHFNYIRQISANGKPVKSEFPQVYDREFEKRISDDASKLQRYWKHLRDLGWKKQDGVWTQH